MEKCIRLGLGQVDLLAKKHTDNYWVGKRLMSQNAKDDVGVTSNRELIRNTIDKTLPMVNSFELLIEYLRSIYRWQIRVTDKTVTFAMPDMKRGIHGNKLGEGYGKAELMDRIKGLIAEKEAKELAWKQMEAEIDALIKAEKEEKRKLAEELNKKEAESAKRNRVFARNSHRFNLYMDEMNRPEWNNAYLDYLEGQEISDWKSATEEMISAPIMTREEFVAIQEKLAEREESVSSYAKEAYEEEIYTEESIMKDAVVENEELVIEVRSEVAVVKPEEPEQIDYTKLSIEERAKILPTPTSDMEAEFKAFKERMGYVGAKLASIRYKMEIYDEFREEYDYRKRYHNVEKVRIMERSRGRGAR